MIARIIVTILEGIVFVAVGSYALLWLAGVVSIVRSLVRLRRGSSSSGVESSVYLRSPEGAGLAEAVRDRRLLRYGFLCVAIVMLAGVAAAIIAAIFNVT